VGQGYDVHRLVPGKPLILGGLTIPHSAGLEGHSDADVLTHAIIDALLGAAALGDIGRHFPDDDESYRGISSLVLLARVRDLLGEKGVRVVNVDAVVMAQEPRLAPHMDAIRGKLSEAMQIPVEAVSVKATTTEGLGFIGRSEGMAAQAVAQVEK
jgi:2-C-methyl-D-erythritol 2,4-cyclodiphosphate synthase